ncbi:hydantoinase/oxoprolinase family protein [Bradyrhizobium genosp. P]|uniref:hydantoinase/oxoprolinase family protein n=1 Tax=Bradyrhizobium genosp. P TaxID=83641 RepID=UPI003CF1C0F3
MDGATLRIGVDVGGTFTDFVLLDSPTGKVRFGKELTTHDDPSRGILDGLQKLLDSHSQSISDLLDLVHATTLVTNAVIERKGARVGLITTKGFRDVLEIGNETRYELYDLFFEKPAPLVPRPLRIEVSERVDAQGRIIDPLLESDVIAAADVLRRNGAEAVAVCLFHSYRNPIHERQVRDILTHVVPELPVTLSSDIAPEIREYERSNTACANSYVQPMVQRYLATLETKLHEKGFGGSLRLMLSNGGVTTIELAQSKPIQLIESGPAAGVAAAGHLSKIIQTPNLLSFDMGGTTAKMCLLRDGEPQRANEFEAARVQRFKKGSGLPMKVPVIDLIEIGAGGGSIAKLDTLGLLKVGPESAGSSPGPISYGRGGRNPTVTDADLVLGFLSPDYFLGGDLHLDLPSVHDAIVNKIADPLGLSVVEAAAGIHQIVNETMAAATRMYLAEKGVDPRLQTLLAFGGAGPVHAYGLAKILDVRRIIVPSGAGVMSALGLLVAHPAVDLARSCLSSLREANWERIELLFEEMLLEAQAIMADAVGGYGALSVTRFADMRFIGQGFEVTVPLPDGPSTRDRSRELELAFIDAYEKLFGTRISDIGVEAVTWRLHASVQCQRDAILHAPRSSTELVEKGQRDVYFPDIGFRRSRIFDRSNLAPGVQLSGPVIIEERESTTIVGPDAKLSVDDQLNLLIDIATASPSE